MPPPAPRRGTGRALLPALLALVLVLVVGLYPYGFQSRGGGRWLALADVDAWGLLVSIALFIPLGFFEGRLAGVVLWQHLRGQAGQGRDARGELRDDAAGRQRGNLVMLLVVMDAALLGLIVETLQLWLPDQHSSILDLIANTIGGTVGGVLAGVRASTQRPTDS